VLTAEYLRMRKPLTTASDAFVEVGELFFGISTLKRRMSVAVDSATHWRPSVARVRLLVDRPPLWSRNLPTLLLRVAPKQGGHQIDTNPSRAGLE
jgi:hypothetical protein